ncbi:glyoxalase [Corynebacterium sp. 13CS0277]|uniref:VOC family protein n=1 Tax=Corynebacterium sp. 13CS0277 TaxID=2071994 RepID=UPI000D042876|nr:VOC family protein [Corynebacterium sp. 13CS0277]PRQ10378.1 glyoxalase [Corynebacterium sp. 13CS0277]
MPAFHAQDGLPYWIDLLTHDVDAAADFYSALLGWDTSSRTADDADDATPVAGYRMARAQGLPVAGFIAQPADAPAGATWVTHFFTPDIDAACARVTEHGGTVTTPPTEVQLGRMALVLDPGDGFFGLIEPRDAEAFVSGGEPGTAVWHELTATADTGFDTTVDFYRDVFGWTTVATTPGDGFSYVTAQVDGAPFAGLWTSDNFPPGVPNFWQTYLGVADLDATCQRVPDLGGRVLRGPWDSEFGRLALVEDPTGGTMTLCEVDEPIIEGHEGDPLEGLDLGDLGTIN